MIKNRFEHSKMFVSCPGDPFHKVRHGIIDTDGSIKLVTDRLENTDDIIDSYRESTEIYNIMARIQAGDTSLLNQKQGFFGDVVDLPKNYAEMLDLIHRGEQFFDKLPAKVKEQYNNDFNQFFADFDNAMKVMVPDQETKLEKEVQSEVKTEE